MSRKWKSEVASELVRQTDICDPERAIESEVSSLLEQMDYEGPPTDLKRVASYCGIQDIVYKEMNNEGLIITLPAGKYIYVNSRQSLGRQRFTVAHEIVHTILPAVDQGNHSDRVTGLFDQESIEEEALCDIGAAQLLVPRKHLIRHMVSVTPSIDGLLLLSNTFEVSLEAMARQIVNVGTWKCAFIVWEPGKRKAHWTSKEQIGLPGLDDVVTTPDPLRVRVSFSSPELDLKIHRNKSVAEKSSVAECCEDCQYSSGRETFSYLCGGDRKFDVESAYIPYWIAIDKACLLRPRVISFLIPADIRD